MSPHKDKSPGKQLEEQVRAAKEGEYLDNIDHEKLDMFAMAALVGYGRVSNHDAATAYCYAIAHTMMKRSRNEREQ